MNNFKPYSYLYKKTSEPAQLRSCFVSKIPAYNNLSGPTITTNGNITTISYTIVSDVTKVREWQFEGENILSWNGHDHTVKVKIGDGSGSTGGLATDLSSTAEFE
ncbi:MAG: hypothetical protein FJY07_11150 [Bacteroidetes bacterium]|nr:hypothetical protein [Bacteroidota bacterium]